MTAHTERLLRLPHLTAEQTALLSLSELLASKAFEVFVQKAAAHLVHEGYVLDIPWGETQIAYVATELKMIGAKCGTCETQLEIATYNKEDGAHIGYMCGVCRWRKAYFHII